jgi:hypothetical protein
MHVSTSANFAFACFYDHAAMIIGVMSAATDPRA